jgi:DinB family protein
MNEPTINASVIATLTELARQVREATLQLLHVPDESWLTWTPRGTANHILWHAGHAVWVQDALFIRPITGLSELPRGWAERFGQDSRPTVPGQAWPEESEVRAALTVQLDRILGILTDDGETIVINANSQPTGGGWPLLAGMIHAWHDEARHQGEMYLLHKLCRESRG